MIRWLHITLVSISVSILALVILVILKRYFHSKTGGGNPGNLFQPAFRWFDHPALITDAVENGWPQFGFADFVSPPVISARSVLGACASPGNDPTAQIGWEVCQGSADFMQKVRLNLNGKKMAAVRTALPLPGPNLGNASFPQEAYFEITVLSCDHWSEKKGNSGEKVKLIGEDFTGKIRPESLSCHVPKTAKIEQVKVARKNGGRILSVGLTVGGPVKLQVPGSYPGSVGFSSNGSVYLDGAKLVHGSREDEWGHPDSVVGCGYNPSQKKVLFTVNSQLVHEIECQTEKFSSPLYPILAASADLTVVVNLGQSPFKFEPANSQRTPNPCFLRTLVASPSLGYEDSKELFSMGRIDSQWRLQRSAPRSNNNTVSSIKDMQYDQESEGDLFEIVLETIGRSPAGEG